MTMFGPLTRSVRGFVKTSVFLTIIILMVPVAIVYRAMRPSDPFALPLRFHRLLLWLLGIRVVVHGEPPADQPVLFAANHASYLDIPVLGAHLRASFVAKSEVATWPLFGFLAKLQNTLFIERRSTRAAAQRTQLQAHLAKKQNLILFPEGTSSNGLYTLPFKSSLFSIAENVDHPITIQPVSVTCTQMNGKDLTVPQRDAYAWYGDMTMVPHLWNVFCQRGFTVVVMFHAAIPHAGQADRKILATTCQERVAQGIAQSLSSMVAA